MKKKSTLSNFLLYNLKIRLMKNQDRLNKTAQITKVKYHKSLKQNSTNH